MAKRGFLHPGSLWSALTWILVIANLAPIFWMVWCSLMGNNEILQGKTVPAPKSNDLIFAQSHAKKASVLAGTLNGELFEYDIHNGQYKTRVDLNTVAAAYAPNEDGTLWILSANRGLLRWDMDSAKIRERYGWNWFKKRFNDQDQTSFVIRPRENKQALWNILAEKLNHYPLVAGSWGASLAKATGVSFPADSTLLDSLNRVLASDTLVLRVLDVWTGVRSWINPAIAQLYAKKQRSSAESRELFRWCLAERFPLPLLRHQRVSWTDIWVNRIPASGHGTSAIHCAPDRLCLGLWWDEFPGIAVFDMKTKTVEWLTVRHGLPSPAVQHLLRLGDSRVLAVTDAGLVIFDPRVPRVLEVFLYGEAGLPFLDNRDVRLAALDSGRVLISYGQELLIFDHQSGKSFAVAFRGMERVASSITAIGIRGNQVFLGTSEGLIVTDTTFKDAGYYRDLFLDQNNSALADGVIHFMEITENHILLAGASGNLAMMDKQGQVRHRHQFPKGGPQWHWRNYQDLWKTIPFGTFLRNSLVICVSVMLISMVVASLASYALARFDFPGKRWFSGVILATQMVPGVLYLIPIFLVFTALQQYLTFTLVNTWHGIIIVYSAFFIPMSTWILRGFFASIPRELEEAALIDGCSPLGAFVRIILPAAMPGIIATGIYVFLLAWDELMFAWVLSTDLNTATIPVGIRLYVGQFGNRFDLLMAAATVATLPVMLLFFLMQKHIVSGLTGGAVKG